MINIKRIEKVYRWDTLIDFGEYKGETVLAVYEIDPVIIFLLHCDVNKFVISDSVFMKLVEDGYITMD